LDGRREKGTWEAKGRQFIKSLAIGRKKVSKVCQKKVEGHTGKKKEEIYY